MWPRKSNKTAADKVEQVADKGTDKAAAKAAKAAAKASEKAGKRSTQLAHAAAYQKPRADLYTVLLVIALLALLLGILFLCLEMNAYDFKFKGGPTPSVAMIRAQKTEVRDRAVASVVRTSLFSPTSDVCPLTSVL